MNLKMPVTKTCGNILAACVLAALLAGCGGSGGNNPGSTPTPTQGQANTPAGTSQSTNWSGYVQSGSVAQFSQVSGNWTVPAANCPSGASTASSTWTGIGGYAVAGGATSDPTLIQAGTEEDCNGGPSYYAWWEALPLPLVMLDTTANPVHPGDQMTVSINSTLILWTIVIHNLSAGWTSTTTAPYTASGLSAEWIQEAPTSIGTGGVAQTTLSNFGRVSFSGLMANNANPGLTVNDGIFMVDANNHVLANPSPPGAGGNSFNDCYGPSPCN
ncbi:MAG: G1 family glutamic endopeptidase [Stenotrophobium sp.]